MTTDWRQHLRPTLAALEVDEVSEIVVVEVNDEVKDKVLEDVVDDVENDIDVVAVAIDVAMSI